MAAPCSPQWLLEYFPDGRLPIPILNLCRKILAANTASRSSTVAEPNPLVSRRGLDGTQFRQSRDGSISLPIRRPGTTRSGLTTDPSDPLGGGGGGGGGIPDWACALAQLGPGCSVADLIAAGVGHLVGLGGNGGGSEPPSMPDPTVPTGFDAGGGCEFPLVRNPVTGNCIDLSALPPGGDPAFVASGDVPVNGRYGPGLRPIQESRTQLKCPPGFVLGKDNVCYDGLARSRRKWDPGMKPLLTGGDRAAIRKAASAANKLKRAKKGIKKASRALDKVC